jgi:heat shock protein HslJ
MTFTPARVRRHSAVRTAVLLLAAAATAASCSDNNLTSPTSPAQLDGTWRLFQMTSSAGVHNEDLTAGRFNVTFANNTIQAKADCNTCSGPATLSASTLTVGPLACTRAACATAPIDTRFTGLLDGALTVRINARLLQLNNTTGGELRFEK